MKQKYILISAMASLVIFSGCFSLDYKKPITEKEIDKAPVNVNGTVAIDENVKKTYKKLKKKLHSKDPNIQTAAAVSLLNLQYDDAFALLFDIIREGKKEKLTIPVLKAFGFYGDDRVLLETIALLDNKNENIRLASAETLGKLKTFKAHKVMIASLLDSQRTIGSRVLIAQALGDVRNRDSVEHLINVLKSKEDELQIAAYNALVKITRQPIGKDVNKWKMWWGLNKSKSREEWLEEIVEQQEEDIKQMEVENETLNKGIAVKTVDLLELYSKNNGEIKIFLEAAKSKYADVRIFAAKELAKRRPPEAKEIFSELLLDENLEVRIVAARTLGQIADKSVLQPLLNAINDENIDVQVAVVRALGRIEMPQVVDALISHLDSKETKVKRAAVEALGQVGDANVIVHLIPLFRDSDPLVREAVAMALGKIKDGRSVDPLIRALLDKEERVRWYAADSLGKLKAKKAVAPLVRLLSDNSARVRESVTASLGQIGDKAAEEHLVKMLDDPDKRVVEKASDALTTIAGDDLEALDNLSNVFLSKKDYERAIKITEKQLAKYSENEEALWNSRIRLAKSFVLTENWDKAVNLYSGLVEHFQDNIELKKELLRSLMSTKQYENALNFLSKWISGPYNHKDFFWKSRLNITSIIFNNGEYVKVKELVDKFENEDSELGGDDLKPDFMSLRKESIKKIKEENLSYKKNDGTGCIMGNNMFLAELQHHRHCVEVL